MTISNRLFWTAGLSLLSLIMSPGRGFAVNPTGTLLIQVQDEEGHEVGTANIFVSGPRRGTLVQARSSATNGAFHLPVGQYRIYAGLTKPIADAVDHYATPEAHVMVQEGETISLILLLKRASQDVVLTENNLRHMGLDPELAKSLN